MRPATDLSFQVMYGMKVLPKGDPYIETAENLVTIGSGLRNSMVFLVDALPFCQPRSFYPASQQLTHRSVSEICSLVDARRRLSEKSTQSTYPKHGGKGSTIHGCEERSRELTPFPACQHNMA